VLIERERVGGECLWTGCVPSKTLIKSAKVFNTVKNCEEFGVHIEKPRALWNAIRLRIADVRDDIKKLEKDEIAKAGLEVLQGEASFVDANTVEVRGKKGTQTISAKKFILAVGLKTRVPEIEGLDDAGFITNQDVFDLPNLPRSLIIIGGGPLGCEFAQAFARLGTKVTLLQRGERLLPRDDIDASVLAQRVLEQSGVTVLLNAETVRAGREEGERAWIEYSQDGATQRVEGSKILMATGKVADFSSLNLGKSACKATRTVWSSMIICAPPRATSGRVAIASVATCGRTPPNTKRKSRCRTRSCR
jgi:pyruvate/2-oxoglutarate dehydrogenase complex dihydrolipoamide dehydrogenase (E3) component